MLRRLASCSLACCLAGSAAFSAGLTDPASIVSRAIDSERDNRSRMVNYLFQEDISRRSLDRDGQEIGMYRTIFEVIFVEGQPAFRQTSLNGRPLSEDEERAESARLRQLAEDRKNNPNALSRAEERRRSHPFRRFRDLHEFQLVGEEVFDGRECFVITSQPKRRIKAETNDDRRIANATARFWIDKETFHRVRMDVLARKPSGAANVRESTSYQWAQRDGSVWLVTSIRTVLPLSGRSNPVAYFEGEQTYSRYRRFSTYSSLTGVEEVLEPQE